ncbi:hypothetical protein [Caballeronia sp. ATUFL_F1_KS39]|uniref:hypothetical protein n=2 Tax=unclassified Caballeronia TaxID=2646786 RepID=UPI00202984A3|nr:hypothetical protein [Caballeronia sp. ATUFL_F1_KS39]
MNYDSRSEITVADAVSQGWAYRSSTSRVIPNILGAISPRVRAREWMPVRQDKPLPVGDLCSLVTDALRSNPSGLAIIFSHDHYLTISGGVQNVVGDEQRALMADGWAFLHVCPNQPLPLLAPPGKAEDFLLVMSLNGSTCGVIRMSDLIAVVDELARDGTRIQPIVHHLLGFAPELVGALIVASKEEPLVWIHDLFTLCPSVHLLRNETRFCKAPPNRSAVCGICHSGLERGEHVERMKAFFDDAKPVVAAPSRTILQFWQEKGGYAHSRAVVIAPSRIEFDGARAARTPDRPLRIAFIGTPIYHKGWDVYEALCRWHHKDERYDFYHLGSRDMKVPGVTFRQVTVTPDDRTAMARAVRDSEIDVVINWSACFESFSFTTQESIAAGAFIVARLGAGNVWPMVCDTPEARGRSLAEEVELQAAFASGDVIKWVDEAARRYGNIELNAYSSELVSTERRA